MLQYLLQVGVWSGGAYVLTPSHNVFGALGAECFVVFSEEAMDFHWHLRKCSDYHFVGDYCGYLESGFSGGRFGRTKSSRCSELNCFLLLARG